MRMVATTAALADALLDPVRGAVERGLRAGGLALGEAGGAIEAGRASAWPDEQALRRRSRLPASPAWLEARRPLTGAASARDETPRRAGDLAAAVELGDVESAGRSGPGPGAASRDAPSVSARIAAPVAQDDAASPALTVEVIPALAAEATPARPTEPVPSPAPSAAPVQGAPVVELADPPRLARAPWQTPPTAAPAQPGLSAATPSPEREARRAQAPSPARSATHDASAPQARPAPEATAPAPGPGLAVAPRAQPSPALAAAPHAPEPWPAPDLVNAAPPSRVPPAPGARATSTYVREATPTEAHEDLASALHFSADVAIVARPDPAQVAEASPLPPIGSPQVMTPGSRPPATPAVAAAAEQLGLALRPALDRAADLTDAALVSADGPRVHNRFEVRVQLGGATPGVDPAALEAALLDLLREAARRHGLEV